MRWPALAIVHKSARGSHFWRALMRRVEICGCSMQGTRLGQALLLFTVVGLAAVPSPAGAAEANPVATTTATPAVVSPPPVVTQANPVATTTAPAVSSPPAVTQANPVTTATPPAVWSPPAAPAASNQVAPSSTFDSSSPRKVNFVLNVPLGYELPGGVNFDGHHGYTVASGQVAHLPKLAGGFGIRPGVGVFVQQFLPKVSGMALFNLDWSRHGAKSYNAGDVAYDHDRATLINTAVELRALLDSMPLKPFVALVPGYGWLKLPAGLTVVDPSTSSTTWRDITLRGLNFAFSLGAMYAITDWLLVEGALGCRFQSYTTSSSGSLSGFGMSPVLNAGLGVSVRL